MAQKPDAMELLRTLILGETKKQDESKVKKQRKPPPENPDFLNLPNVSLRGAENTSWTDDDLKNRTGIKLSAMTAKGISLLGKSVLTNLCNSPTEQSIGYALIFAWNISSTHSSYKRIYPDDDETATNEDVAILKLATTVLVEEKGEAVIELSGHDDEDAAGICFLCGSILKMFVKPPSNYILSINHIISSYPKFYQGNSISITGFRPSDKSIQAISDCLRDRPIMLNTLTGLLYHLEDIKVGRSITMFLFEIHLANTGMHSWSLFLKNVDKSGMSTSDYLLWLNCRITAKPINTIKIICEKYLAPKDNNKKKMTWRFSRLYDPTCFFSLQTSKCTELTRIQAGLSKHFGVPNVENIYNIKAISMMTPEAAERWDKVATNIFNMWNNLAAQENELFDVEE